MAHIFDPDEIFEMALQLERNGAAFYRNAAENVPDSQNKKLLLGLAKMEEDHERDFTILRKKLTDSKPDYYDPDGEAARYLQSIADTKIFFERGLDITSMKEILKEAILAEKDSTIFYMGLKELVPDEPGKNKLEQIIKEEMTHIRILSEKLADIK